MRAARSATFVHRRNAVPPMMLPEETVLGPESAGLLMSAEEFDEIEQYDDNYQYELVHGVVVVSPIPLPVERGPNELLACFLWQYQETHPQGKALDLTLPQEYVRTATGRRIADRLIWAGLGRMADRQGPAFDCRGIRVGDQARKTARRPRSEPNRPEKAND